MTPFITDPRTALAVIVLALIYAASCWRWPYKPCKACKGASRFKQPFSKAFRLCGTCKGSGRRIRTGRRVLRLFGLRRL